MEDVKSNQMPKTVDWFAVSHMKPWPRESSGPVPAEVLHPDSNFPWVANALCLALIDRSMRYYGSHGFSYKHRIYSMNSPCRPQKFLLYSVQTPSPLRLP